VQPNTLPLSRSVLQSCSNTFDERFTVEWSYLLFLVSHNSPRNISTILLIVFLTFALIRFSCAAKRFVEVLPQKSEEFFRGLVLQPLAGIRLFH
jgi:hypothetical protein